MRPPASRLAAALTLALLALALLALALRAPVGATATARAADTAATTDDAAIAVPSTAPALLPARS